MLRKIFVFVVLFAFAVASAQAAIRTVPDPYTTIQAAVDAADPGDTILVGPGDYKGALIGAEGFPIYVPVDKANLKIIGSGDVTHITEPIVIVLTFTSPDGGTEIQELLPLGFGIAADGVEISNFSFDNLPAIAVSGSADNGKLSRLTITNTLMGICLFNSSGWTITNNTINGFLALPGDGGGGIVMITSSGELKGLPPKVVETKNNLIAFNNINHAGALTPGAAYFGIMFENAVLPHGELPFHLAGGPVENNKIVHNKVMISVSNALAVGLQLLDYNPILPPSIQEDIQTENNLVGFNDFRGSDIEILVMPPYPPPLPPFPSLLDPEYNNLLSRNLGTGGLYDGLGPNRAYDGVPPTSFIPVMPK